MKLSQAVELFLGEHKLTTQRAYAHSLLPMRDWLGPARDLSDISSALLIEYFQKRIHNRGYALATIQKHTKGVKTFFNWCVRIGELDKSPAAAIRGRKLPRAIDRSKAMTDAELAAMLSAVVYKPRDYALLMFLADTGCRRGGAAGLQIKDLDLGAKQATVTEKGERERKVAFGDACATALVKWLAYRSAKHRIKGTYIFTSDGLQMNAENISLIIRRAAKTAGVRVLSSHSLRHRKGHQLADARIAPSIAATALGHSDVTITLTSYYPADWESAERALRELVTNPAALSDTPKIVRFGG